MGVFRSFNYVVDSYYVIRKGGLLMSDAIESVTLKVFVQENGIIRLDETGRFLGQLDG